MSSQLTVAYAAMGQAVDDILRCVRNLHADREDLENFLRTLKAEWYGQGSDQWQGVQNDWNQSCDEINGVLAQLQAALDQALENYATADRAITGMWGGAR